MDEPAAPDVGGIALATGVVAIGSAACIATYFAVGGPFGPLNDLGNASIGLLSGALAWRLRSRLSGRTGRVTVFGAIAGAAASTLGSALVVTQTTGFFLAGLISTLGFAGIGVWLLALNRSDGTIEWPRRLRTLGAAAGALMVLGVTGVPAILLRLDDAATAPGWAWFGFSGWLGIYLVYPAWAIRVARASSGASRAAPRQSTGKEASGWTPG